jgi:hypothetical protein
MGNVFGLVLGSYEGITPPVPIPGQRELPKVPWRESVSLHSHLYFPLVFFAIFSSNGDKIKFRCKVHGV